MLSDLIKACRAQLHRIDYEWIICDGGSTDGTLEWLYKQPDVKLIEHGNLRGAIRAFTDAANMATGQYVALLNDDVVPFQYSLLAAIRHLEHTPTCGAVAFADNRTNRMYGGDGSQYRVEGMGARNPDGTPHNMVAYAQVGLFRKALGDKAGWWGADDPVMGKARTYGGDNFLSAKIWEMGYTVDAVDGCKVRDKFEHDRLRQINAAGGSEDGGRYYSIYPDGVPIPTTPVQLPEANPPIRFLMLPIYEGRKPMRDNLEYSLSDAFKAYGHVVEFDYLNEHIDLEAACKAWQPDIVITQFQGVGERLTAEHLSKARLAAPGAIFVNWSGDAHEDGLISDGVLEMVRNIDIQTTVNAKVLPVYQKKGLKATYWQINYKDPVGDVPDMPTHDVLFQANWYDYRRPMFDALKKLSFSGLDVGLYGNHGFATGNTHYDFAAQHALYRNAKITIGDTFPGTVGFVSNRLFQALSAGAFLLQQYSQDLDKWTGLIPGVHYVQWDTVDDLPEKIQYWIRPEMDEKRREIAECGKAFVREHFSADAQAAKLFSEVLPVMKSNA